MLGLNRNTLRKKINDHKIVLRKFPADEALPSHFYAMVDPLADMSRSSSPDCCSTPALESCNCA